MEIIKFTDVNVTIKSFIGIIEYSAIVIIFSLFNFNYKWIIIKVIAISFNLVTEMVKYRFKTNEFVIEESHIQQALNFLASFNMQFNHQEIHC